MSVEVRDFRQLREKKTEEAIKDATKQAVLVPQEKIETETGHEDFDKLLRAIAALDAPIAAEQEQVKIKGMGAVQDEMIRLCQLQYMFVCGKREGLKEISKLVDQILVEKKNA